MPEKEHFETLIVGAGNYGLMLPGIQALHALTAEQTEGPVDADNARYFLSKIELRPGPGSTMATWRKRLFIATFLIPPLLLRWWRRRKGAQAG